ncbi:CBF-domain-containing protein [Coprinopsis marcescibilis]|uniref:CBF-domain-containing protein n=1 Tax=Coprinopsis marcescibilis TaxID=230819 RepID=A0A5C3KJ46_COPMA|nr:CBF-domain-containing protein [Coprinopsis marcescibilis]
MAAPLRSLPPATKRRKVEHSHPSASASSSKNTLEQIKKLEEDISKALKNETSLNALADLVHIVLQSKDAGETSKGIYALYRTFVSLVGAGKLALVGGDEAAKKVRAWLWERLNAYADYLVRLMKDEEKILRTSALQILFSLQKHLSSSLSSATSQPQFHVGHFKKIVNGLLLCPASARTKSANDEGTIEPDVLDLFYETWFSVHDDIRWFFLREAATTITRSTSKPSLSTTKNLLSILEKLATFPTEQKELDAWWVPELGSKPPKPKKLRADEDEGDDVAPPAGDEEEEDDWRKFFDEPAPSTDDKKPTATARLHQLTVHQSLHSLASHKAVFTRAWLALLPAVEAAGDREERRALSVRVLNVMHRGVLPHLTRPILAMDWIGNCVDMGGSVGLLALNGLFTLMKEYNLDYPSFYTRLYAFLDRDVLHLKHRARFFRMTDLFLSSTHLPATLLASFIKRLSRLSLNAPPSAVVMIIPFTYNILKKHPALMVMIHRSAEDGADDPYLPTEPNPLSTNALQSSLWELYTHKQHWHASVSTLCKIFEEAFTKPSYAMEDFLDHTYGTLMETDVNRKIKKEPPLAMECDAKVDMFPSGEDEERKAKGGDLVSELWTF